MNQTLKPHDISGWEWQPSTIGTLELDNILEWINQRGIQYFLDEWLFFAA